VDTTIAQKSSWPERNTRPRGRKRESGAETVTGAPEIIFDNSFLSSLRQTKPSIIPLKKLNPEKFKIYRDLLI